MSAPSSPTVRSVVYDMSPERAADALHHMHVSPTPTGFFAQSINDAAMSPIAPTALSMGLSPVDMTVQTTPERYVLRTSPPSLPKKSLVRQGGESCTTDTIIGSAKGFTPVGPRLCPLYAPRGCEWPSLPNGSLGEISPPGKPSRTGLYEGRLWSDVEVHHSPAIKSPLLLLPSPNADIADVIQVPPRVPRVIDFKTIDMDSDLDLCIAEPKPPARLSEKRNRKQIPSDYVDSPLFDDSETEDDEICHINKTGRYGTHPVGIMKKVSAYPVSDSEDTQVDEEYVPTMPTYSPTSPDYAPCQRFAK